MSLERFRRLSRTVGFRLTLLHSVLFTVLGVLILGLAHFMLNEIVQKREQDQIEFRTNQFADQYRRNGQAGVEELCGLRKGRQQKAFFVRIADAHNRTQFLRDAEDWAEFQVELLVHPPGASNDGGRAWLRLPFRDAYVLEVLSHRFSDGTVLQVGKSDEETSVLLRRFRQLSILIIVMVIPIGFAVGGFFALRALRPVRQITETVEGILRTGEFDARVSSKHSGDELDELVELFNGLLEKIQALIRAMRDSLDNVAHDLRTPMTRLRNVAQASLEKSVDLNAAHDGLADCLEESERVLTMLNTMMDISEAENGIIKLNRQSLEIRDVIDDVVDLYSDFADDGGIALRTEVASELRTCADPLMLRRALANLIDNAIKHTDRGGEVVISAHHETSGIVVSVRDTGEGIVPEELPRIWDRLYRVDRSRSARGLGLGLSFVKAIVEAHGGFAEASSKKGEGSVFTIHLDPPPKSPEPDPSVVARA